MNCSFCGKEGLSGNGYKLHVKYVHPENYDEETKEVVEDEPVVEEIVDSSISRNSSQYKVTKTGNSSVPLVADDEVYYLSAGSSIVVDEIENENELGSSYRIEEIAN